MNRTFPGKTAGIVAEYNPFHAGHMYHIAETKKQAEAIVAVMSGNFVQRCEPAVCDKHSRAKMAVLGGTDLVLELPVRFAVASAEKFASGAVSILNSLGFIDILSFGSESGNLDRLKEIAEKIDGVTSDEYKAALKDGKTFASARQQIIGSELCQPNDILAVEYIRALKKIKSEIEPFTVKRTDGYHESATVLRNGIFRGEFSHLPDFSSELLKEEIKNGRAPADIKNIERLLLGFVRNADEKTFKKIYGINEKEGFGGRILKAARAASLGELYALIKTKRYTMATVRRAVLSAYLKLKKNSDPPAPYIRVLAFSEKGKELLKNVDPSVKIIHNLAEIKDIFPDFADEERRATDLFLLATPEIGAGYEEFTRKFK